MSDQPQAAEVVGHPFSTSRTDEAPLPSPNQLPDSGLNVLAANLPAIAWTFNEAEKRYEGDAPYGSFTLYRHDAGHLQATFASKIDEGLTQTINLNDCDSVGAAKRALAKKVLDSLNQTQRLEVVTKGAEQAEGPFEEPDLV